ncbi:hypothetical protein [Clostridium sp. LIBA-8841]|uniref:hypothetical protein n=1 Tax=Clostridium sp. LIBA-8841 TaxID=2987530 RepID=UPI002AC3C881|nr:hypothetical protein [Clostridium sp. LIBA-8841]MDZ5252383.1 hypothetical protein [Clostridium sp. LIBA-8841]
MGKTNISYGAKDILYKLMGQLYKGRPLEALGVSDMPKIMDRLPRNFFENEVLEGGPNEIFILEDGSILLFGYEDERNIDENMFIYLEVAVKVIKRYYKHRGTFPKVRMAIIYNSSVKEARNTLSFGDILICSESIFMSELSGEKVLNELKPKVIEGNLTQADKIKFIMLPLMKNEYEDTNMLRECVQLAKSIKSERDEAIILNGIIESTDKFINDDQARELKELLEMTKIERLYNEERDIAVKNARKEEQLRIAKNLAGILSAELISEKLGITIEEIYELQNAEG